MKTFFTKLGKILFWFFGIVLFVLLMLFLCKGFILSSLGNALIKEDKLEKVDYLFVLGGNALDRGNEAANLWKTGYCKTIVCLGGNDMPNAKALGLDYKESMVTQRNIRRNGVDSLDVILLAVGTSTKEESEAILNFCLDNQVKKAIILSDKFHTSRVQTLFEPLEQKHDISFIVHGAPNSNYSEELWWQSEDGLIMVNNEWVKKLYYFLNY